MTSLLRPGPAYHLMASVAVLAVFGLIPAALYTHAGEAWEFPPSALLRLAGAGCFSPRIVWLAIRGADALQRQVDEALAGLYAPEQRFMGHVTIARTRRMPDRMRRAVEALEVPDLEAQVTSFSLQASHLSQTGTRYETLAKFGLPES